MSNTLFFLTLLATAAVAAAPPRSGRPVYSVVEDKEVAIASINGKSILLKDAKGGSYRLSVGPKTWIIKDGDEASFEDLRVGQRLHIRYIPRTSQAVTLELLPPAKKESAVKDKNDGELQKLEMDWTQAILENDAEAIGRFLPEDWVIIGPEGNVIDKPRFLAVIKAGDLIHESMEFEDSRMRVYGDTAVITAQARSKGKYKGQAFSTHERSTSVYAKHDGRWQCVLTHLTPITKK